MIPEVQGIVRSRVNPEMVEGVIRTIVGGFSLGDPIMTARVEVRIEPLMASNRGLEAAFFGICNLYKKLFFYCPFHL